ncbi:hypothetical protein L9F63_026803, partial [Diploptera punctata]
TSPLVLSREQKQTLTESCQLFCSLRCQVTQLIGIRRHRCVIAKTGYVAKLVWSTKGSASNIYYLLGAVSHVLILLSF